MRIISGKFRSKKLATSEHLKGLRPTTDKNREALFNILSSAKFIKEMGLRIDEASVLDVCCGSGSVAFEFLSRGAKLAFLIDNNILHLDLAKKNSKMMKFEDSCQFLLCDVKKNLPNAEEIFDFVFIDPPYEENYSEIINNLKTTGWLNSKSLIVIESDSDQKEILNDCNFLKILDLRKYGATRFGFYQILS